VIFTVSGLQRRKVFVFQQVNFQLSLSFAVESRDQEYDQLHLKLQKTKIDL